MTPTWMVVVGMNNTFYVASVSGGKDSLAMFLLLLTMPRSIYPLTHVVYYNTGMDFDCIARIIARVKVLCEEQGLQFIELHPKEPFLYCFADKIVENRDGSGYHYGYSWCGGLCRWATRHKINAINHFKDSLGGTVIDYIGIAYDEKDRLEKEKSPNKRFPLVELGMTEAMCLEFCRSQGFMWLEETERTESGYIDLYDILKRVSCWCCANKNLDELRNIYLYLPHYWNRLKDLQARTERPMKGFNKCGPVGVFELEQRFKKELSNNE